MLRYCTFFKVNQLSFLIFKNNSNCKKCKFFTRRKTFKKTKNKVDNGWMLAFANSLKRQSKA